MSDKKATTEKAGNTQASVAPAFKFEVAKNLTLPLLKPQLDQPIYIRFEEPLKIGKEIGDKDAAIIGTVTNLETGEMSQYLVPAVFQGILHDEYGTPKFGSPEKGQPVQIVEAAREGQPADSYVGKCFMVTKHPKASGKGYHPQTIQEIVVK